MRWTYLHILYLFHIYTATSKSSLPQVWVLAKNLCLCLWQTQKHASLSGRAFNHWRSSTNSAKSNIVDMHTSVRKMPCPVHCLIFNHKSSVMHKCVCHGEPCGSSRHWITLPETIVPPNVQCSSHRADTYTYLHKWLEGVNFKEVTHLLKSLSKVVLTVPLLWPMLNRLRQRRKDTSVLRMNWFRLFWNLFLFCYNMNAWSLKCTPMNTNFIEDKFFCRIMINLSASKYKLM